MRSTILRLERRIQEEHANALASMQGLYEELATAVLAAGREAGYLGTDPLGAVAQLGAPPPVGDVAIGQAVLELWRVFFAGFRADEAQFEAARFAEEASEINARVEALGSDDAVPPDLLRSLIDTLIVFLEERQASVSDRLDHLIAELNQHQARLGSGDLERAYLTDEMQRANALVVTALVDLGEEIDNESKMSQLVGQLITRWRREYAKLRESAQQAAGRYQGFLRALEAAARNQELDEEETKRYPNLGNAPRAVVRQVGELVTTCRELEEDVNDLRGERAALHTERDQLRQELSQRDRLVARYEMAEMSQGDEDDRLALYREIVARLEAGKDAGPLLAQVRERERVLLVARHQHDQAVRLLDGQGDSLVRHLRELYRLLPLSEDPRRYRPRLLGASPYKLKTLAGQMRAARDCGRDLLQYLDRARWVVGVESFTDDFKRLRKIFGEMIELVGECRDRVGGPPPVSLSVSLDTSSGLTSLPKLLAIDVQSLARRKGAARLAALILPVLEECVGEFRRSLAKALGEELATPTPPKREAATSALKRLADELLELGTRMETVFVEARAADWQLDAAEERLAGENALFAQILKGIDSACDVLAVLDGAPATPFARLPGGRSPDLDKLLVCTRERVEWLEDIAAYRVELRE